MGLYFCKGDKDGIIVDLDSARRSVAEQQRIMADYGFILRYLQGKEHITGYGYEPWHIRYVDDTKVAKEAASL